MRVPYKGVGWLVIICWVPELFQHLQEGCGILSWPTWLAPWRHDDGGWWWDFHLTQNRDTTWKPKKNGCQKKKTKPTTQKMPTARVFCCFCFGAFFLLESNSFCMLFRKCEGDLFSNIGLHSSTMLLPSQRTVYLDLIKVVANNKKNPQKVV